MNFELNDVQGLVGQWKVGDVSVSRVVEMEICKGLEWLLPDVTKSGVSEVKWLKPHFASEDDDLLLSIHLLVVDTPGGNRIAVDTCVGNDKDRHGGFESFHHQRLPFLENLIAAGYPPESFTHVLCTHLHVDHVGWNTKLENGKWVPTFPNAKYIFGRKEYEFWCQTAKEVTDPDDSTPNIMNDSVRPIVDAGLVDLVEQDAVIINEPNCVLRLVPTQGHTPGHVSVMINSRDKRAMITGDWMHHPIQMSRLDISAYNVDTDCVAARNMRIKMLDELADTDILVFVTHFATPSAGYVKRENARFKFEPVFGDPKSKL